MKNTKLYKYYCYKHIRLDTNEVFYIGIGTARNYERAKSKRNRNRHWLNIIKKTNFTIEIIFETDVKEEIFAKEKELIEFYGRRDLKTGSLVNLTNGGEGLYGYCPEYLYKPVFTYDLNGNFLEEFKCARLACEYYKIKNNSITACCNGERRSKNNLQWRYYKTEKISPIKERYKSTSEKLSKIVIQLDEKGLEINRFNNIKVAAHFFNMSGHTISSYIKNNTKRIGKNKDLIFKYL